VAVSTALATGFGLGGGDGVGAGTHCGGRTVNDAGRYRARGSTISRGRGGIVHHPGVAVRKPHRPSISASAALSWMAFAAFTRDGAAIRRSIKRQ
jgi:hypothetical protein